jgi:hypothetical protein
MPAKEMLAVHMRRGVGFAPVRLHGGRSRLGIRPVLRRLRLPSRVRRTSAIAFTSISSSLTEERAVILGK